MQCKRIMEAIEAKCPPEYACEWDNVGLLAGRDDKEVRKIYVALDADDPVIDEAAAFGADMLVTHHPLIFQGLRSVSNKSLIGNRVVRLLQNDISYYAAHTNYDVARMADLAAERLGIRQSEVLEVTVPGEVCRGIGRIGSLEQPMSAGEYGSFVREQFRLPGVRLFGEQSRRISRVAVCPGSGKSVLGTALAKGAELIVTGDIGHHEGIDAAAQGLCVLDAGHYGLEHIFVEDLCALLGGVSEELEIKGAPVRHPFSVL